jgi:hypothetical protein
MEHCAYALAYAIPRGAAKASYTYTQCGFFMHLHLQIDAKVEIPSQTRNVIMNVVVSMWVLSECLLLSEGNLTAESRMKEVLGLFFPSFSL